jgi:hypothetical protein
MAVPYPKPLDALGADWGYRQLYRGGTDGRGGDERSPSTLLSATHLVLGCGEHRSKALSLGASWDAIKPTAQLGGEFRERAHRQQQKCRSAMIA